MRYYQSGAENLGIRADRGAGRRPPPGLFAQRGTFRATGPTRWFEVLAAAETRLPSGCGADGVGVEMGQFSDMRPAEQDWLTAHPEGRLIVLECGLCRTAVRVDLDMPSGSHLAVLFVDEHERAHSA